MKAKGRPAKKLKQIQKHLLAEARDGRYPTLWEAASAMDCHYMTVSRARHDLVAKGLLPEPPRSHRPPRASKAPGPVAQLVEQRTLNPSVEGSIPSRPTPPPYEPDPITVKGYSLDSIPIALTPEEQREELSRLARDGSRDEVRVSALSALARLDAMTGSQAGAGIPPPLTEEDRIARLSALCRAVGEGLARRAFERAFGVSA